MDVQLPLPDVVSSVVPIGTLEGTAKSLALAAQKAGYTIRVTRALGPRAPRLPSQPVERIGTLALVGVKDQWRFVAMWNIRDGWDVVQYRPGWHPVPSNVQALRDTFKAQTTLKVA